MKARTEEFLYAVLWVVDALTNPTLRNFTDSFEGWADRRGLLRRIHALERQQLLERIAPVAFEGAYRLTEEGRSRAFGGLDHCKEWGRPWDGIWRMVVFDIPEAERHQRARLRRALRAHRFGRLQRSLWITPDPLNGLLSDWSWHADARSLVTLEAEVPDRQSEATMVAAAWDFQAINSAYGRWLTLLDERPMAKEGNAAVCRRLLDWSRQERIAWREAIAFDPLLPSALLPPHYLGQQAWKRRAEACGARRSGTD